VWDVSTGQERWPKPAKLGSLPPLTLAYSVDGKYVAAAAKNLIKIWDATSGAEIKRLPGPSHMVHFLAFRPDGRQLATASWDGLVTLWDVDSGKKSHVLRGHKDRAIGVAYSPDGRRLASSGCDNIVLLWDSQTGEKLNTLTGHIGYALGLVFSNDGKTLATNSGHRYRGEILLWDVAALEKKQQD
jgi:WD40 repeat protein